METVGVSWVGDRINVQHFKCRRKDHLVGKAQGAGQDLVLPELLVERDADAAAADVDGSLDERGFCRIGLLLQADWEGDGDAIVLAAISR